jgi:beta-mannanase
MALGCGGGGKAGTGGEGGTGGTAGTGGTTDTGNAGGTGGGAGGTGGGGAGGNTGGTTTSSDSGPSLSNPNASQAAKNVYAFLASRAGSATNRMIEGQHLGGINEIQLPGGFDINTHAINGKLPAMIGTRYDANDKSKPGKPYTLSATLDSAINSKLIDIWKTNGTIVHLTAVAPNPWDWESGRSDSPLDQPLSTLFKDAPSSAAKTSFWSSIDIIAAGLKELKDANVPVVFRPFPELNIQKYYFVNQTPADFITLWKQVRDYYINTKGLDNLIFCWEAWVLDRPANSADVAPWYPGDDSVDVVAGAFYFLYDKTYFTPDGKLSFPEPNDKTIFDTLLTFKKPFGAAQWGLNQKEPNNTPGDNAFTLKFMQNVPTLSFAYYWTGYQQVELQQNGPEFVADPNVCTADDLPKF